MKTISKAEAWAKIEATNGKTFGAKTIKRGNGAERTFNCRLSRTVQTGKVGGTLNYTPGEHDLISIFEMGNAEPNPKDRYKMLNMTNLLEVAIGGERFMVRADAS